MCAVAGLSLRNRAAATSPVPGSAAARTQASALLKSLPVAVLADPVAGKSNQGVVLSVAPLLGADPLVDKNVAKWLHVHVRPSVRGLLRVLKVGVLRCTASVKRQHSSDHMTCARGLKENIVFCGYGCSTCHALTVLPRNDFCMAPKQLGI